MPDPGTQERMQILKMIEEGRVTPEEGAKLLEALRGGRPSAPASPAAGQGKWFCVRVTDLKTGRRKVNVNIPMSLINIGARIGAKFAAPVNVDIEEILAAVRSGQQGKLLEVEDQADGERVEIFVE